MSTLPKAAEDILATGFIGPEFQAAWKARGSPSGDMPVDVVTLKQMIEASLPGLRSQLAASRPSNIIETEHKIPLSTGFTSRVLVCQATSQDTTTTTTTAPSPIILLFHGGIHVLGFPEFDLKLARALALAHNATVICPSTRKAPEHPFPAIIDDAWALLQAVAQEAALTSTPTPTPTGGGGARQQRTFLPAHADARGARGGGFIVGGASSGANVADVVAHLARDGGLTPPLTGLFLACGGFIDPGRVPAPYRDGYLSREQNKDAPGGLSEGFLRAFRDAVAPDAESPLWAPFVQRYYPDGGVAAGHRGMPRVYFQVCGMDVNRDDSLLYERVLREECGVPTRMDLYKGFPHCWWDMYPELEASKRRMEDTIEGFGWLLDRKTAPGQGAGVGDD